MASDQSNRPGALVRIELLHDEGGVGAEHHHLAMRHVDDAHDAEGDGKADGGKQQHRAEREAVPDVLRHVPDGEPIVDGRRWRRRRRAARRPAGSAGSALSSAARIAVAALAQDRRSPRACRPPWRRRCRERRRRAPAPSARLTRGSVSLAIAASSVGSALASRDLNTACAASRRMAGSGASSVRPPSAAR